MEAKVEYLIERLRAETNKITEDVEYEIRVFWAWGIDRIKNESIRNAVKTYYLNRVPYQFFISSSSNSGNHHPVWHNVPEGIVRHLTECCVNADRLLSMFGLEGANREVFYWARDIVLAATVITDTQKNGVPWGEKSERRHGEFAAKIWDEVAKECGVPEFYAHSVSHAVFYHYGRFTEIMIDGQKIEIDLLSLPKLTMIVHLLDAMSSNKDIELIYSPVKRIPFPKAES